jgi:hypothetical protein
VPFALGVLAAAGLTISKFGEASFLAQMSIAALVFLPIGMAAGFVSRAPIFVVGLVIVGGIAVAVTVDALSDSVDRNLFPLEILWLWVLAALPSFIGVIIGRLFSRRMNGEKVAV